MNDLQKVPPPDDFDDNPEWTAEDFARARPASDVHGPEVAAFMVRKRGRPVKAEAERKQQVTLRLSPDVLAGLKAAGPGWQTRADAMLRRALKQEAKRKRA